MSQFRSMMPAVETPIAVNINALITMSARLATVLEAESALLRTMKLKEIGPLQEEKIQLSHNIGLNQQVLRAHPELLNEADPVALEKLILITEELQDIIAENMRLNTIARNVNQRVVNVISDALRDRQRPTTYNRYGGTSKGTNITVSLNLNQKA